MINQNFVIVAAILNFIGAFSYLIDTLKGKIQPNKVTWLSISAGITLLTIKVWNVANYGFPLYILLMSLLLLVLIKFKLGKPLQKFLKKS